MKGRKANLISRPRQVHDLEEELANVHSARAMEVSQLNDELNGLRARLLHFENKANETASDGAGSSGDTEMSQHKTQHKTRESVGE